MTTSTTHASAALPARGRHARPAVHPGAWWLLLLGLLSLSVVVRTWNIGTAYELFIDEVTYAEVAVSVAQGDGVRLHGEPFHLHPPGFFGTSGLLVALLGLQGADLADVAFALRPLPALLGAVTPVLVAVMVRRVSGSVLAALAVGLLLALDPFLVRFDSRVMLEAQAMVLATAGTLLLLVLVLRHERAAALRSTPVLTVLCGLLLAGSLLSKETYAFVAVLPVLLLLVTGLLLPRRTSATVLGVVTAVYLTYVAVVAAVGQLPVWLDQKTRGVQRLLGLVHETGFNMEGSPSFLDRVLVNLAGLGVTYALIGLGGLAVARLLLLLVRRRDLPGVSRAGTVLLVVWAVGAFAHLGYALTIGTLEEQMFYLLVVTAVPVLGVAVRVELLRRRARGDDRRRPVPARVLPGVVVVLLVGALVVEAGVWWRLRTVPDDGYARLLTWAETGLPGDARLASTEEVAQFVMPDRLVVRTETAAEVRELGARHVLVVSELLDQGYSRIDDDLQQLLDDGRVVHSTQTRTSGRIAVYKVDPGDATG